MTIRALLVDDEPMARDLIRADLGDIDGVTVVGEAADGQAAIDGIRALEPEVLFLDIEMPGVSGLDLVRELDRPPLVIFVTAHPQFAVDAFRLDVLDYLTKPVSIERLEEAVRRAERELSRRRAPETERLSGTAPPPQRIGDALLGPDDCIARFVVRALGRIHLVRAADVNWAAAAGNYVELHTDSGRYLVRMTLADLAEHMDPSRFRRIHRSYVVNLDQIAGIQSDGHGAWDVELFCGQTLRMSPTYKPDVLGFS